MWTKFRHKVVFGIVRPFFIIYLKWKYGYTAKKYKLNKGPHLILFNHPTNLDPFMLALSFKRPIYFMATDDIFSIRFISPIIRYLVAPISKSKSFRDIQAIKNVIKVVKEGGTVCLSPEGNRTYSGRLAHIDKAIIKLIKHLNIPVVLYNIVGGYGVNPRWSPNKNLRKGKMYGEVNRILSVNEINELDDEKLYDTIINTLNVNDYKLNLKYKGNKLAERLERIFYLCPVCGSISKMYSHKNHFYCSQCHLDVEYTEDMTFKSNNKIFKFKTVFDWYIYQEEFIRNIHLVDDKELFFDNEVVLKHVIKNKKKNKMLTGRLSINNEKIKVEDNNKIFEFKLSTISSMTVMGQNKLNFYIDKDIYQLKSNEKFNALKYMQLYYTMKSIRLGEKNEFLGI